MKRIFSDYVYANGPRDGCWWPETCETPKRLAIDGEHQADVAIIGGGFTGVSAALHLALAGVKVVLLEANFVGWGASGRNGGFCCLGGGMAKNATLDAQYGRDARLSFRATERAAIDLVENLINRYGLEVDRHSHGETELAHRPTDMVALRARVLEIEEDYGVAPQIIEKCDLTKEGMVGPFFGGLTTPVGFGLNPLKYLNGIAAEAEAVGVKIFHDSQVLQHKTIRQGTKLICENGSVLAEHVILASNGYSSDDLPNWLAGRYMPSQSSVLVTRPLTESEIDLQGWRSAQMSFDTRNLLHYFRLMPDRRFLFGMRGGLLGGPNAEARARTRVRRNFKSMFQEWAHVDTPYEWSGMVCLARHRQPFVGAIPGHAGWWTGMCYHGNGVAMGSFAGKLVAELVQGRQPELCSDAMLRPLPKFPFGRGRRLVMPFVYAGLSYADL